MTDTQERMTDKQIETTIHLLETDRATGPGFAVQAITQLRTDLAAANERADKAERQRKNTAAAVVLAQDIIAKHEDERDTLRTENAALREALEHIKKHQETVCPTGYKLSSTWVIANNALAGKETPND